jgi:hypothetical protein
VVVPVTEGQAKTPAQVEMSLPATVKNRRHVVVPTTELIQKDNPVIVSPACDSMLKG